MNKDATVLTRPDQTRPDQTRPDRDSVLKKVLHVTLYAPTGNYGCTLQNYALQETLKSLGFEVDAIRCPLKEFGFPQRILHSLIRNIKGSVKLFLAIAGVPKYRAGLKRKLSNVERLRKNIFEDFLDNFIDRIIPSTYREALNSNPDRWSCYSYVVAGSDQIWNKGIVGTDEALRFYYLSFVERSKRVNYASSFGNSSLKASEYSIHKEGLEGFERLSCREESGCKLIHELTGKEAQLVLDPTLLLTAEQWRKIARKPDYEVPEHYALTYFLGKNYSHAMDNIENVLPNIADAKADEKLEALDIFSHNCGKSYYLTGPREFVWLIDHADYVFTSSFHGTAFAINFGRNFTSFWKDSKKGVEDISRLQNLLSLLGLDEHLCTNVSDIPITSINYDVVNEKLNTLRESSINYLRECLK